MHFGCDPNKVDELHFLVLSILKNASLAPPVEDEVNIVRKQLLRAHEVNLRENESWVAQFQNALKREKDPLRILKYPKYVEDLTPLEIWEEGMRCLCLDNRLELIWLPHQT